MFGEQERLEELYIERLERNMKRLMVMMVGAMLLIALSMIQLLLPRQPSLTLMPSVYKTASMQLAVSTDGQVIENLVIELPKGYRIRATPLPEGTYFAADQRGWWQCRVNVDPLGNIKVVKIPRGPI